MIEVLEEEVLKLFESLSLNKSAGPDHVPAIIIVKGAKSLVNPLSLLYHRSFTEGVVGSYDLEIGLCHSHS